MKKQTTRIFAVLLAVLMIAVSVPVAYAAPVATGKCGASLNWSLSSSGVLTITGTGKMTDTCTWSDYADQVKTVSLPVGLTEIGAGSFEHNENLTSISIPEGVKRIGIHAFSYCKSLKSASLPSTLTGIGNTAFDYCSSLTSIKIPAGISEIQAYTFMGCTAMQAIFLPTSVKNIGFNAFKNCRKLKKVYYAGSEREWRLITMEEGNEVLQADDLTIKFNATELEASADVSGSSSGNIFQRILAFFRNLFGRLFPFLRRTSN